MARKAVVIAILYVAVIAATAASQEHTRYTAVYDGKNRPVWIPEPLPIPVFSAANIKPGAPPPRPRTPEEKIHPDLRALMVEQPGISLQPVIIEFEEDLVIPRFPSLDHEKSRAHPDNQRVLADRQALADRLLAERKQRRQPYIAPLSARGISVLEDFWLTNSVRASVPLGLVRTLSEDPRIVSLQPEHTRVPPPTIQAGRQVINADALRGYG